MDPYIFFGTVLPERAMISFQLEFAFSHPSTGFGGQVTVSVILNQILVQVSSEDPWDIWDLRNVVLSSLRAEVAAVGYIKGYAYHVEIARVLHTSRNIDLVFGIDVPCISASRTMTELMPAMEQLRAPRSGENGIYINRCFTDLNLALRNADDTPFYCYRAIEALRHHCSAVNHLKEANRSTQWKEFRDRSGVREADIREISEAAKEIRHGGHTSFDGNGRAKILQHTWNIVDCYLSSFQNRS
ncbi:hypothetical protein R3X27_24910 [Tropicimonas sp. TH_r6]|uniref:hypothetical protein n=1 Tax=Tropicimonas sp. TH_r6 TaxID=3082085 RepID=UPI002954F5FB|nr:hypothetical protein [Tropicimonas sp. TH_r6]MDV7145930.1 hypothetical protein [Tropicimonas sp. TH_r6]